MLPNNFHLNDPLLSVPHIKKPVNLSTLHDMSANMRSVDAWIRHYQPRLPQGAIIDEVAILVPDPYHQNRLDRYLQEEGWERFNDDRDAVFTNPFGTRYMVEYGFYRHPEQAIRLEVMMLLEDGQGVMGFSPLHRALWSPSGEPDLGSTHYPIPHLSFKMSGLWHTEGGAESVGLRRSYSLAVQHLKDQACLHAMTCQSQYGAFGYFISNDADRQIYVKPRINLRDDQ